MAVSGELTPEVLNDLCSKFNANQQNIIAQNICTKTDPSDALLSRKSIETTNYIFAHKIEPEGKPITNQKKTGQCWLFAACNTIRVPFMKQYNLEEFEFSQTYLFFWDKIERCNYFLHNIVKATKKGEQVDGRIISFLITDPMFDGGQWEMLVNLVNKYGLMPKVCFPESHSSESSSRMNFILTSKVREYAKEMRDLVESGASDANIEARILDYVNVLFRIVGICLGVPSKTFTWEYYDKSKNYNCIGPITPLEFYQKYVKPYFNVDDKVCLVTDPRPCNPFGHLYTVEYLGNIVGRGGVKYNNQPVDLLLELVKESIKQNEPVWFGCDVDKRCAFKQGISDLKCQDYKFLFGTDIQLGLSKADRLLYGESAMSHAMVFTAITLTKEGKVEKLRVENSWGSERSDKGYDVMTADWFKEFGFEIVVDKKYVPADVLAVMEQKPIVLPPWDPLGVLAH